MKMADNPLICEEILENYGNPDHLKLEEEEEEIHTLFCNRRTADTF